MSIFSGGGGGALGEERAASHHGLHPLDPQDKKLLCDEGVIFEAGRGGLGGSCLVDHPQARPHKTKTCRRVTYPESYITKDTTFPKMSNPGGVVGRGSTWRGAGCLPQRPSSPWPLRRFSRRQPIFIWFRPGERCLPRHKSRVKRFKANLKPVLT